MLKGRRLQITEALAEAGICSDDAELYGKLIAESNVCVHITGPQGPTGKTTLCAKLKELGANAFEDFELDKKSDSNAVYIEIALVKKVGERNALRCKTSIHA